MDNMNIWYTKIDDFIGQKYEIIATKTINIENTTLIKKTSLILSSRILINPNIPGNRELYKIVTDALLISILFLINYEILRF